MQLLLIKNFGPIRSVRFEPGKCNIFIGPQASGKSTIVKCIYFFNVLRDDLLLDLFNRIEGNIWPEKYIKVFSGLLKKRFLDFWGPTLHLNEIDLQYNYSDDDWIRITLSNPGNFINPSYSDSFIQGLRSLVAYVKTESEKYHTAHKEVKFAGDLLALQAKRSIFNEDVVNRVYKLFGENRKLLFIPAGRSLISILTDQLNNVSENRLDQITSEFIKHIVDTRQRFHNFLPELISLLNVTNSVKPDKVLLNEAQLIINRILKGTYIYSKDGERLFIDKDHYVKLNYASSGQQETVWILLIIFTLLISKTPVLLVIEEPEAHLHPAAQKDIVDLIALLNNTNGNKIFITTHSPYILSSLNNLLYAWQTGRANPTEVNKIISEKYWIDPSNSSVSLLHSGTSENILDDETKLIEIEKLDSISGEIMSVFDQIYEIELANKKR